MQTYDANDLNVGISILFTQLGAALSLGLCAIGGAYGTARTGVAIASLVGAQDDPSGDNEVHLE
jgi:F0F1-type ATP synthase membrane subunit c/vacuolar-type H+-ATPase subunit K